MEQVTDRTKARIAKLLRLSENTTSQSEAQSAMLKAQEMLFANGLSEGEVKGFEEDTRLSDPVINQTVDRGGVKNYKSWQSDIARVVADNFRCYFYLYSYYYTDTSGRYRQGKKFKMMGRTRDVEAAVMTLEFALRAFEACWKQYHKDNISGQGYQRYQTEDMKVSYTNGFVKGLRDRFAAQVQERALIIRKDNQLIDEYKEMSMRRHSVPSRWHQKSTGAYNQGYRDGKISKRDAFITAG